MQARRRAGREARPDIFSQSQQPHGDTSSHANQYPPVQGLVTNSGFTRPPTFNAPPAVPPLKPTSSFQTPPAFLQQSSNYYQQPPKAPTPGGPPPSLATPVHSHSSYTTNGMPPPHVQSNAEAFDPSWSWGAEENTQVSYQSVASNQQFANVYNNANDVYSNQYTQQNVPDTVAATPPVVSNQYAPPPQQQNYQPPRRVSVTASQPQRPPSSYQAPPPVALPTQPSQQPAYAGINVVQPPQVSYPQRYPLVSASSSQVSAPGNSLVPDYYNQAYSGNPENQVYTVPGADSEQYSQEASKTDYIGYAAESKQGQQDSYAGYGAEAYSGYQGENGADQGYQNQPAYPDPAYYQEDNNLSFQQQVSGNQSAHQGYQNHPTYPDQAYYQEENNQNFQPQVYESQGPQEQMSQPGQYEHYPPEDYVQQEVGDTTPVYTATPPNVPSSTGPEAEPGGAVVESVVEATPSPGDTGNLQPMSDLMQDDPFRNSSTLKSGYSLTSSMNQQDNEGSEISTQRSERTFEEYYNGNHEQYRELSNVEGSMSDRMESLSLTGSRGRVDNEATWENRNGEHHTRTSAVSFALDALDNIPGPRLPMDSDAWSRASTWGSGYDDHPRSILSSSPAEMHENNGAKSIERSNSFDGSSIVESYAPGSVDSESLSNTQFDERGSKAVSGRTTPFEEDSVSRNLSREPSFDRGSRDDASDVGPLPPSSISFHDGFEGILKPTPITDSTTSLAGSQSVLSSMTNGSPPGVIKSIGRLEPAVLPIEPRGLGERSERTDAEGSLDSEAAAVPIPVRLPASLGMNQDEADGPADTYPTQRQAAYGQPALPPHQNRFSRPSSAASRPSPATTPNVTYSQQPPRGVEVPRSTARPNYPEGPNYVAEEDGNMSTPPGLSHSASFSRELPPSSQRMVPGMSGGDLRQGTSQPTVPQREENRVAPPSIRHTNQRPQQRPQNVAPQTSAALQPRNVELQRSSQPPEGAVERVQDDRLPLQNPNVDSHPAPVRPNSFRILPPSEDRTDSRQRHSEEPEGAPLPLDPARLQTQRPHQRNARGVEGASAPTQQPPRIGRPPSTVPLGPHPEPEGTAASVQSQRPTLQPHAHSTPEEREGGHLRPEGRESIPASPLPREGRQSRNRAGNITPVDDEQGRYHGAGAGGSGNQTDGSDRVVTGYALDDTLHSISGDRGPRSLADGPNGASSARSATIGSEQNLASAAADRLLDDRRSREPEDRLRSRGDRRPRREEEEYRDRRYDDSYRRSDDRHRDRRRYPGDESDEDDRSYYESRREKKRGERRYADDDELYPPSRNSVFGEDTDRYADERSELSDLEDFSSGRRRPAREVPYPEEEKSRRRYGRERLDSRESRNDRRDYDRGDPRDYRSRDPRDQRDPYSRDHYRDRDIDAYGRRRDPAMPYMYPQGASQYPGMYYPQAGYDPRQLQLYYAQYYAQMAMRARPGAGVTMAVPSGQEERTMSRSSTTDEIRQERASAAETLSEIGVPVQEERKFYDDAHVKGIFVPDGSMIKMISGLPSHQLPSSLAFLDISEVYESLPEYQEINCFPGPLVSGQTNINSLLQFCNDKVLQLQDGRRHLTDEVQSRILIWEFLVLLLKTSGKPEGTAIARLLLQDTANLDRSPLDAGEVASLEDISLQDRTVIAGRPDDGFVKEYRSLLNFGCKQKALDLAIKRGLWGHAFTLSFYMDQKSFNLVRSKFTNSLSAHDPLQTLYQLESGRQPAACTTLGDERKPDWRSHLAMILSNPSSRDPQLDKRSIVAMGDSLAVRGDACAAQLCYLVAGVEFGHLSDKSARMSLVGKARSQSLDEFQFIECVQMTEIYEFAMSLSQPTFCIKLFLIQKFVYAKNLLNYGFNLEAYQYCEAIWNGLSKNVTADDLGLASQLYALADRLKQNDPSSTLEDEYGNRVAAVPEWLTALYTQLYTPMSASVAPEEAEPMPAIEQLPEPVLQPSVQDVPLIESSESAFDAQQSQQDYGQFQQDQPQQNYDSVDSTYAGYYNQTQQPADGEDAFGYYDQPSMVSPIEPAQPTFSFMNTAPTSDYTQQHQQNEETRQTDQQKEENQLRNRRQTPRSQLPTPQETPQPSALLYQRPMGNEQPRDSHFIAPPEFSRSQPPTPLLERKQAASSPFNGRGQLASASSFGAGLAPRTPTAEGRLKPVVYNGTYPIDKPLVSRNFPTAMTYPIDMPVDQLQSFVEDGICADSEAGESGEEDDEEGDWETEAEVPVCEPTQSGDQAAARDEKEEEKKEKPRGLFQKIFGLGSSVPKAKLPDDKEKKIVWDPEKKRWIDKDNPDAAEALATPPPRVAAVIPNVAAPDVNTPPMGKPGTGRRPPRVDVFSKNKLESPGAPPSFLASTPIGPGPGTPTMLFQPAPAQQDGMVDVLTKGEPTETEPVAPSNVTPQTTRPTMNRRRQYVQPTSR